jgi:hypothetical protein
MTIAVILLSAVLALVLIVLWTKAPPPTQPHDNDIDAWMP